MIGIITYLRIIIRGWITWYYVVDVSVLVKMNWAWRRIYLDWKQRKGEKSDELNYLKYYLKRMDWMWERGMFACLNRERKSGIGHWVEI